MTLIWDGGGAGANHATVVLTKLLLIKSVNWHKHSAVVVAEGNDTTTSALLSYENTKLLPINSANGHIWVDRGEGQRRDN